jgi:kynurenine formamidase
MTRIVELSHHIVSGDAGYPGLPTPHVRPHLSHAAAAGRYAEGATFEITHVSMVGNTGTYLDSPAHGSPDGRPSPASRSRNWWTSARSWSTRQPTAPSRSSSR